MSHKLSAHERYLQEERQRWNGDNCVVAGADDFEDHDPFNLGLPEFFPTQVRDDVRTTIEGIGPSSYLNRLADTVILHKITPQQGDDFFEWFKSHTRPK